MPKTVSSDLRSRVVAMIDEGGHTQHEIAERFMVSRSFVSKVAVRLNVEGNAFARQRGGTPRLGQDHLDFIASLLRDDPTTTLAEIQDRCQWHFRLQTPLSIAAIRRAVNKDIGCLLRHVHDESMDGNSPDCLARRQQWVQKWLAHDGSAHHAVYLDEDCFGDHCGGRSSEGPRSGRGSMSLLIAVSRDGVLHYEIGQGTRRADTFLAFLRQLLQRISERGYSRTRIIIDTDRTHEAVHQAIVDAGHMAYLLPPSSPSLNVATWTFGYIKSHTSQDQSATAPCFDKEAKIEEAIASITRERVVDWMDQVGRNTVKALRSEPLDRAYSHLRHGTTDRCN